MVSPSVPTNPRSCRAPTRTGGLVLLALTVALFLPGSQVIARPGGLRLSPLLTWTLSDGEATILRFAGKEYRFAPQSFFWKDGVVTLVNRFDPLLVRYVSGRKTPEQVLPITHAQDQKLVARFFTDLCEEGGRTYLLEETTATIRRAGSDGAIDAAWLLTATEGAIITRFWRAGPSAFWLYDEGRGQLLFRRCDLPPDSDRDAPGTEHPLTAESLSVGGGRLFVLDREGEADWALLSLAPEEPAAPPTVVETQSADEFRVLDVDAAGTAYVYLRDRTGPALLRVQGESRLERFPLAGPLVFPDDRGRVGQAIAANRLLLLVLRRPAEIALAEVRLP